VYRYFVSQSSEFCRHNLLCYFVSQKVVVVVVVVDGGGGGGGGGGVYFVIDSVRKTFGYTLVCWLLKNRVI
jgi:hypothetical protein